MRKCYLVGICALSLALGFHLLGESPNSPPELGRLVQIVKSAGHGQIGLTDVQPWRGSKEAYHTLLPLLREEPANNNIWRNALQALVGISLGSPVREKLTLEGLERFAVDANSFSLRGRQPVLGVNVFADGTENWAAYNAKHDVPRLIC